MHYYVLPVAIVHRKTSHYTAKKSIQSSLSQNQLGTRFQLCGKSLQSKMTAQIAPNKPKKC